MTNPLANAQVYQALIGGSLSPGSVYPLGGINTYRLAQQAATAAIRGLLGADPVDFHVIARTDSSEPLYRTRWRLYAEYGGPYLRPFTSDEHDTTIDLKLWVRPLTEQYQLAIPAEDLARPEMPYRTIISELYTAHVLRAAFGTEQRQITVGEFGTVSFTPQTQTYQPMGTFRQRTLPIGVDPLPEYAFVQSDDGSPGRALWLGLTGAPIGQGWKVSYCSENGLLETRWDDPHEPIPEYELVPFDPPTPA